LSVFSQTAVEGLEGWKHMPTALRPRFMTTRWRRELEISTEQAYRMVKRLAREEVCSSAKPAQRCWDALSCENDRTGRTRKHRHGFADSASSI